jgi:hypothetical protein
MPDWLTALDDGLTQRLRCCSLCLSPITPAHVFDVYELGPRAVATLLCPKCYTAAGQAALATVLASRYDGKESHGPPRVSESS